MARAVPLWYRLPRPILLDRPRAGTMGTWGTLQDASTPSTRRLGVERSLVQIQSPRLGWASPPSPRPHESWRAPRSDIVALHGERQRIARYCAGPCRRRASTPRARPWRAFSVGTTRVAQSGRRACKPGAFGDHLRQSRRAKNRGAAVQLPYSGGTFTARPARRSRSLPRASADSWSRSSRRAR